MMLQELLGITGLYEALGLDLDLKELLKFNQFQKSQKDTLQIQKRNWIVQKEY